MANLSDGGICFFHSVMYAVFVFVCGIVPSIQKSAIITELPSAEKWTCATLSQKINKYEEKYSKSPRDDLIDSLRKARMKRYAMSCIPKYFIFQIGIGFVGTAASFIFKSCALKHNLLIAGAGWITGSIAWWVLSGHGAFEGSHKSQVLLITSGLALSVLSLLCRIGWLPCQRDIILLADVISLFLVFGGVLAYNVAALVNMDMF